MFSEGKKLTDGLTFWKIDPPVLFSQIEFCSLGERILTVKEMPLVAYETEKMDAAKNGPVIELIEHGKDLPCVYQRTNSNIRVFCQKSSFFKAMKYGWISVGKIYKTSDDYFLLQGQTTQQRKYIDIEKLFNTGLRIMGYTPKSINVIDELPIEMQEETGLRNRLNFGEIKCVGFSKFQPPLMPSTHYPFWVVIDLQETLWEVKESQKEYASDIWEGIIEGITRHDIQEKEEQIQKAALYILKEIYL